MNAQPRRRLEIPPVKSACLACRASKARCNGESPCNRCRTKRRDCQYLPSQRGRVARAPRTPPSASNKIGSPSSVENAGCNASNKETSDVTDALAYRSSRELLDAYYLLIHPQFPVLPPSPDRLPDGYGLGSPVVHAIDSHVSPLIPAITALTVLVPKRAVISCTAVQERVARRYYAERCCGLALAGIDRDMDASEPLTRSRLHPEVPVHLESTIANFIVALYEYDYRGTMMRARTRISSVITMAIDLGLQDAGQETSSDSECKKRVWAMILFFANKLSIIHHLPPLTSLGEPRFKTSPQYQCITPEPWGPILRAQEILLTMQARPPATKELESLDMNLCVYLQDLDRPLTGCSPDNVENLATHNWWAIARIVVHSARIKLHRISAFSDLPAFVNKHCDMTALQEAKLFPMPVINCHELPSPESLAESPISDDWSATEATGPFSAQGSAEICLKSAFVVLRMFRYLTEVLPDRHLQLSGLNELDEEEKRAIKASLPLIMPLMACSAMQACYVMIMTLYKVKSTLVAGDTSSDLSFLETERLVEELRYGVRDSLTMLEKYRAEFAHIGAMYEELKLVNQVAFADV